MMSRFGPRVTKWVRLCVGVFSLLLLECSMARAADLLVDEDFAHWSDRQWTLPGSWEPEGWRLYGTSTAVGSFRIVDAAEGRYARLTRTGTAGDMGLDRWDSDQRLLVAPGTRVYVRVWARRVSAAATLAVELHEFQGATYTTGLNNPHTYALTTDFTPYLFTVTVAGTTSEVSPKFSVQGSGTLDVQRIEVGVLPPALNFVSEAFASWPALNLVLPGTVQHQGWRFFGVSGATGQMQLVSTSDGPAVRLTRTNTSGDAAMDRDLADLRVFTGPGRALRFKVWARQVGSASLRLSLAELDRSGAFLGQENANTFALTSQFAPYEYTVVTAAGTSYVNPALRVAALGSVEVSRIELTQEGVATPLIELPQGWTPSPRPELYWRGPAHQALRVQLAEQPNFATLSYDSGTLADGRQHFKVPTLAAGARRYARVQVQDFDGQWSAWSSPTLIYYQPQEQAAAGTVYVYDLSPTRQLTQAEAFEQAHFVAALQGLANREQPRLAVRFLDVDDGWLDELRKPGRWLENSTYFQLGASGGRYRMVNGVLEITRSNLIGDAGVDRWPTDSRIAVPTSTSVQFKVWARLVSGTSKLKLSMTETQGDTVIAGHDVSQTFTLSSSFQPITITVTTASNVETIAPGIRLEGMGVVEVQRMELAGTSNGQTYFSDDLTGWSSIDLTLPGHWLENDWRLFGTSNPTIESLLSKFPDAYNGVVLWDPAVPATSNVASTIAGVEGLLPIPLRDVSGSLYQRLVTGGPHLPVVVNLVGKFTGSGTIPDTGEASSGSAKNDAYRWAIKRYLETGLCDPGVLGYYLDAYWIGRAGQGGDFSNHTQTNQDFFIQHKGFLFDLGVWDDEAPADDPGQALGTDKATLKRLMATVAQLTGGKIIHIGGFTPWPWKYVEPYGGHEGVATEWETVRILSNYNAYIDADAPGLTALSNASLYSLMPPIKTYRQPPPPRLEDCQSAGLLSAEGAVTPQSYYINYIGDYDAAAWMISQLPSRWDVWQRGKLTLSWAWGPQLMQRGMPVFDRYVREATPRDIIWGPDNGAGYLNPTQLTAPRSESGLPDGTASWQSHCLDWFRRLGIRSTGFVIDGGGPPITRAQEAMYETFSGDGMVTQYQGAADGDIHLVGTMPVVDNAHGGLSSDPATAANEVAALVSGPGQTRFLPVRSILKETSFYSGLDRTLRRDHADINPVLLDPLSFFYVLRHKLGGENRYRALFLDISLYGEPRAGLPVAGTLVVRNAGWDCWPASGTTAVRAGLELTTSDVRGNPKLVDLPADIYPGQLAVIPFTVTAPSTTGTLLLRADLQQGGVWFGDKGNPAELREVTVGDAPAKSASRIPWGLFD